MIRLRLFGPLDLRSDDGVEIRSVLAQPKRMAILAYLAVAGRFGFMRREALLSMFWPELREARARNALSKSLHHLRRSLGQAAIINRGTSELSISSERIACDVVEFESSVESDPETALDLYAAGPFMNNFGLDEAPDFEQWVDARRVLLQQKALAAARALLEREESADRLESAIRWTRVAQGIVPFDEVTLRRELHLLDRAGDRAGAVRAYDEFAGRLQRDLDLAPSPETTALLQSILDRDDIDAASTDATPISTRTQRSRGSVVIDRYNAPVQHSRPSPDGDADAKSQLRSDRCDGPRWKTVAAPARWIAALTVLLACGIAALSRMHRGALIPMGDALVLAVPFRNETLDPALDPVGRLAQDWIARELQGTGLIRVVDPLNAATAMEGFGRPDDRRTADALTVARAFGAALIVQGSFFRQGDSLQFVATITDARTGAAIPPRLPSVMSSIEDPFAGVQHLQSIVSGALGTMLDPGIASLGTAGSMPPSYAAYGSFMNGLEHFQSGRRTEAMNAFERASRADPHFALPVIWRIFLDREERPDVADSLLRQLMSFPEPHSRLDRLAIDYFEASRPDPKCDFRPLGFCPTTRPDLQLDRALEGARLAPGSLWNFLAARNLYYRNRLPEALRYLQGIDPEAGWAREWVNYWNGRTKLNHLLGDYRSELDAARRVRDLAPGGAGPIGLEALALIGLGRFGQVETHVENLLRAPPDRTLAIPINTLHGVALELAAHGQPAAAERVRRRAIAWASSPASEDWMRIRPLAEQRRERERVDRHLAELLFLDGRWQEADRAAREILAMNPTDRTARLVLAGLAARRGDVPDAEAQMDGFLAQDDYEAAARIAALLGDRDRALEYLRYAQSNADLDPLTLHRSADWDMLRGDPTFREFLSDTG